MSDEYSLEEKNKSPLKISLILGGILGVFMLIYNYIFIWNSDMGGNVIYKYIQYLIILGFGLAAIKIHRDKNLGGEITYKKAFVASFYTVLWFAIIIAGFIYFYFKSNTEKVDELTSLYNKANDIQLQKREITDEQYETKKEIIQWLNGPISLSLKAFLDWFLLGLITSLIAAAFHKLIKPKKA